MIILLGALLSVILYITIAGIIFGRMNPPELCYGKNKMERHNILECAGPWTICWNIGHCCRDCYEYRKAFNTAIIWPVMLPLAAGKKLFYFWANITIVPQEEHREKEEVNHD